MSKRITIKEIAERAGSTTYYYWGNAMDTSYVVCSENSGNSTVAVGSRLPNAWGLYDTCGNVFEIMRDESSAGSNLANNPDAFTPSYFNTNRHYAHGGGAYNYASTSDRFHSSMRESAGTTIEKYPTNGFRVSYVRQ